MANVAPGNLDRCVADDAVEANAKQSESRLAECGRRARQAISDGRRARYARDVVAFQAALKRFMDAFSVWQCARDESIPSNALDVTG